MRRFASFDRIVVIDDGVNIDLSDDVAEIPRNSAFANERVSRQNLAPKPRVRQSRPGIRSAS